MELPVVILSGQVKYLFHFLTCGNTDETKYLTEIISLIPTK